MDLNAAWQIEPARGASAPDATRKTGFDDATGRSKEMELVGMVVSVAKGACRRRRWTRGRPSREGRRLQTIDFLVMHEAQEWLENATGFRR